MDASTIWVLIPLGAFTMVIAKRWLAMKERQTVVASNAIAAMPATATTMVMPARAAMPIRRCAPKTPGSPTNCDRSSSASRRSSVHHAASSSGRKSPW